MKTLVSALLITAVVAAFYSGAAESVVDRDIVLALPFDEGRGETTKDLSPHSNHGTLKGNANWGAGKFGNAVQVEPVGYVDAGNHRSLRLFPSDYTLAVWVNMDDSMDDRHAFIAQDEGVGQRNKWIFAYRFHGNARIGLRSVSVDKDNDGDFKAESIGTLFDWKAGPKKWHQIAVVRRTVRQLGYEYTIYADGKQVDWNRNGERRLITRFIPDAPVTIGFAEEDIGLDGLIDEVLLAKRAFSADEITKHFYGGVRGVLGLGVLAVQRQGKSAIAWGAIKANIFHRNLQ